MEEFLNFRADVKALSSDGPGEFEAILSTPDLDREGETIKAGALTLPASIPIYVDHDWRSGALPVAKAIPSYDTQGQIVVKGSFARHARAQDVRHLVADGIIDSMSVGFLNGKRDRKSGAVQVISGEVFEGSFTGIPANPQARVLAAKTVSEKAGARNASDDQQRLDEIHDLAVAAGANCAAASKTITGKSIVGTVEALQDRVRDALEDAYGDFNTYLRGVNPDDMLVFFDWYGSDGDTYQQSYTDDGNVVTLEGEAVEVDVHEVVVPDADADREENDSGPTMLSVTPTSAKTKAAVDAAAPDGAAADPAADEVEQVKARLRLLAVTV